MIEPIMYFGFGFLAASLLALVIVPLVHNRAVRLTMRRMEASMPLSMAETWAQKDQLRAEFAMLTRRLEITVEQLKTKTTNQLAELGKKTDAINRLKLELVERTATIFALQAREQELTRLTAGLRERSITADNERTKVAAPKTQVGSLRDQIAGLDNDVEKAQRFRRERLGAEEAALYSEGVRSPLGLAIQPRGRW